MAYHAGLGGITDNIYSKGIEIFFNKSKGKDKF